MARTMKNNRILSIVVTYYPEEDLLKQNLASFVSMVDKVIIWENTPEDRKMSFRYINHPKVDYYGDGINSISHALNYAWQYAKKNGYDYLLTMDQDSVINHFEKLKEYALQHFSEMIIMGPSLLPSDNEGALIEAIKSEEIITSGMLVPVKVLNFLGGYDERLTIDGIDTDLCLRASLQKIYTYQINGCFIQQRFGQPLVKYHKGVKYEINSYPANRLRSILKAHVYLMRKYPNMSSNTKSYIKNHYIRGKLREILLFEDKKLSKSYNLLKGILEGLLMKV